MPGEVCFGGAIAVGYLQQPELTVARFISNPLSDAMQRDKRVPLASCLYRSGDLAMRLETHGGCLYAQINKYNKMWRALQGGGPDACADCLSSVQTLPHAHPESCIDRPTLLTTHTAYSHTYIQATV